MEIAELQRLLNAGVITPSTNVIAEGQTVWQPASSILHPVAFSPVRSVKTRAAGAGLEAPTFLADIVGRFLEWVRRLIGAEGFETTAQFSTKLGHLLLLLGAALSVIYSIVYAIRTNSFILFLVGILAVLMIALLQFVAKQFLDGCRRLLANSPSRISSMAVLDCFGLILLIAALFAFLGGFVAAVATSSFQPFGFGLASGALLFISAVIALHPSILSISVEKASAGEEFMGIVSFFLKNALALLPVTFALTSATGVYLITSSLFSGQSAGYYGGPALFGQMEILSRASAVLGSGAAGFGVLILAAILPFLVYVFFLWAYLMIDVIRSILVLPSKLDSLRR